MPNQVSGPRSGFGKPPTSQYGTSPRTVPGTKIVNRIDFRIGPRARVIFNSKKLSHRSRWAQADTGGKARRDRPRAGSPSHTQVQADNRAASTSLNTNNQQ